MRARFWTGMALATAMADIAFGLPRATSWFEPRRVLTANSGFPSALHLLNNAYDCADFFTKLSVDVTGDVINLAYQENRDTSRICPLIELDYGPTFPLPSLKVGYYQVHYQITPPCSGPLCELGAPPTYAGMLAAADTISWFLKHDTVNANTPFSLQLLNPAYGNCLTGFSHAGAVVLRVGMIMTSFTVEYYAGKSCIVDPHPHGPAFKMDGLPEGRYPVEVVEQPLCAWDSLPCSPTLSVISGVDTLTVRTGSPIVPARKIRLRMQGPYPMGLFRGRTLDGRKAPGIREVMP